MLSPVGHFFVRMGYAGNKKLMQIEYEATFENINKEEVRQRLKKAGAELLRPEFLQKRVTFNLPLGVSTSHNWIRVRDEGDKITMSLKVVDGAGIENQKEICLEVDDMKKAEGLLLFLGCKKKAYQENKREIWQLDNVEVTIDEWPFLEPFVEIEGDSEESVRGVAEKLGFNYKDALFCAITTLYERKYNIPAHVINNKIPKITFDMDNPLLDIRP